MYILVPSLTGIALYGRAVVTSY